MERKELNQIKDIVFQYETLLGKKWSYTLLCRKLENSKHYDHYNKELQKVNDRLYSLDRQWERLCKKTAEQNNSL